MAGGGEIQVLEKIDPPSRCDDLHPAGVDAISGGDPGIRILISCHQKASCLRNSGDANTRTQAAPVRRALLWLIRNKENPPRTCKDNYKQ
jgi:hypothetical protein